MAREFFENYNPSAETRKTILKANSIIESYLAQGLTLTLRQLYYQFVSRDLIPNTEKSYKRLGSIISSARCGGLVDWDALEDRVRRPVIWAEHASPKAMLESALRSYRLPRLDGQSVYVELWVEKDALAGVLEPIAAEYHVTLMVNRGYSSSSAMKESADRIRRKCKRYGVSEAIVFYLGDHDPSGEDMVRDISERLHQFLNNGLLVDWSGDEVTVETIADSRTRHPKIWLDVRKLALTMEQIEEYSPPPNPAKLSDSRAKAYVDKHGDSSWEVDALDPTTLRDIITEALESVLDMEKIETIKVREEEHKVSLLKAAKTLED
jgi:hypothetical protein